MPIRILLCCFWALPGLAFADAGDGQFMGYELGTRYPGSPREFETTTTGNLLIAAENPVKPDDIDEVSLIATPQSQTIGFIVAASWHASEEEARAAGRRYVELLRAKYPDWGVSRESMDASFRIVAVDLDKAPYSLQLRLARDEREGRSMWRFSMGLGWHSESDEAQAWRNRAAAEQAGITATENERRITEADTRGL